MNLVKLTITLLLLIFSTAPLAAMEIRNFELPEELDVDVRIFEAEGDTILLGFACDEGMGINEQATANELAKDGIEVWMPDMLGAYMLPKVKSSLEEIPTDAILSLVDKAHATGKKVYLIAGGSETELILRGAANYEALHKGEEHGLSGAILLFPRLLEGEPVPGQEPKYVEAVGKTRIPLMLLEGERTPNRWGVNHLTSALEDGGSDVFAKVIPSVRGYFFNRNDPNVPEELVTSQLSGLIKASLFFLSGAHHETE